MWAYIVILLTYSSLYTLYEINMNKKYKKQKQPDKTLLTLLVYIHAMVYFIISFSIFFIMYSKNVNNNLILGYIMILILLLIHWATNDNKCYLTELMNEYFGFQRNDNFRTVIDIYNDDYPTVALSSSRIQSEYLTVCGEILFLFIVYLTN